MKRFLVIIMVLAMAAGVWADAKYTNKSTSYLIEPFFVIDEDGLYLLDDFDSVWIVQANSVASRTTVLTASNTYDAGESYPQTYMFYLNAAACTASIGKTTGNYAWWVYAKGTDGKHTPWAGTYYVEDSSKANSDSLVYVLKDSIYAILDTLQRFTKPTSDSLYAMLDTLQRFTKPQTDSLRAVLDTLQRFTKRQTDTLQAIIDTLQLYDGWVAQQTEVANLDGWNPITDNDSLVVDQSTLADMVTGYSTLTTSDNIGINWADISNPTTTVGLSGTTVGLATDITNTVTFDNTSIATVTNLTNLPDSADMVNGIYDKFTTGTNENEFKATGFSTHSAADVWAVGTRALTDKAGFKLAADGLDADTSFAQLQGLVNSNLDEKISDQDYSPSNWGADAADSTLLRKIVWYADTATYNPTAGSYGQVLATPSYVQGAGTDATPSQWDSTDIALMRQYTWYASRELFGDSAGTTGDTTQWSTVADVWQGIDTTTTIDTSDIGAWFVNNIAGGGTSLDSVYKLLDAKPDTNELMTENDTILHVRYVDTVEVLRKLETDAIEAGDFANGAIDSSVFAASTIYKILKTFIGIGYEAHPDTLGNLLNLIYSYIDGNGTGGIDADIDAIASDVGNILLYTDGDSTDGIDATIAAIGSGSGAGIGDSSIARIDSILVSLGYDDAAASITNKLGGFMGGANADVKSKIDSMFADLNLTLTYTNGDSIYGIDEMIAGLSTIEATLPESLYTKIDSSITLLNDIEDDSSGGSGSCSGSGTEACTLLIVDDSGLPGAPIQNARLYVYTLDQTACRVNGEPTDVNGKAIVHLDSSDYYIVINSNNQEQYKDTITVTQDSTWDITMTTFSPSAPVRAGGAVLYGWTSDIMGDTLVGATFRVVPVLKSGINWKDGSGIWVLPSGGTDKSDANGYFELEVYRSDYLTGFKWNGVATSDTLKYDIYLEKTGYTPGMLKNQYITADSTRIGD